VETEPRGQRPNVKDAVIVAREFKNLKGCGSFASDAM